MTESNASETAQKPIITLTPSYGYTFSDSKSLNDHVTRDALKLQGTKNYSFGLTTVIQPHFSIGGRLDYFVSSAETSFNGMGLEHSMTGVLFNGIAELHTDAYQPLYVGISTSLGFAPLAIYQVSSKNYNTGYKSDDSFSSYMYSAAAGAFCAIKVAGPISIRTDLGYKFQYAPEISSLSDPSKKLVSTTDGSNININLSGLYIGAAVTVSL